MVCLIIALWCLASVPSPSCDTKRLFAFCRWLFSCIEHFTGPGFASMSPANKRRCVGRLVEPNQHGKTRTGVGKGRFSGGIFPAEWTCQRRRDNSNFDVVRFVSVLSWSFGFAFSRESFVGLLVLRLPPRARTNPWAPNILNTSSCQCEQKANIVVVLCLLKRQLKLNWKKPSVQESFEFCLFLEFFERSTIHNSLDFDDNPPFCLAFFEQYWNQ